MNKARSTATPPTEAQPQTIPIPPRTPAALAPAAPEAKPSPSPLAVAVPGAKVRNSVLSPDAFSTSLVTENGSYEFDRVLKSGYVRKRTRKTKVSRVCITVTIPLRLALHSPHIY